MAHGHDRGALPRQPRVDHLSRLRTPSAIGLDETSFLAANGMHPTLLMTGFVELDRNRLIDVVPGRDADAVTTWLAAKPPVWLAGIETHLAPVGRSDPDELHDIRHSYATALIRAGVPVKVVSQRIGHANPAITMQVYQHVLPGDDEEAAAVGAKAILGGHA